MLQPTGKVLDVRWDKNHDSNFFRSVGKEWQLERKSSIYFRTKRKFYLKKNEINEMKQTKN